MDWKLELVVVPVADIDGAKDIYTDRAGFDLLVDHRAGEDFRVVQLVPPGSHCAIALDAQPRGGGLAPGPAPGGGRHRPGPCRSDRPRGASQRHLPLRVGSAGDGAGPDGADYGSFLSFADPDGNGWMIQEVGRTAQA